MSARRSKKDKPPTTIAITLAQNVIALRDRKYQDLPNESAMNEALGKECHCAKEQIRRITNGALDTGIDMLEYLAIALDTRPQDLVTPFFAAKYTSEVKHPPERPSDSLRASEGTPLDS